MRKISFDKLDKYIRIGFVIVAMGCFLFVISGAFALLYPDPPEPQIKYGEFPFKITYEINGEIMIYEDVIICEYAGIESLGTAGNVNKWSERLKSGNANIVLLQSKTEASAFQIYTLIPGWPDYYMGQNIAAYEFAMKDGKCLSRYLLYKQNDTEYSLSVKEAWEKYGVRIIDIECSPPIENIFVEKDR